MASSFRRKLIRIGETSTGVILPKGWVRHNGLHPGDRVEVVSNDHVSITPVKGDDGDSEEEVR